jgi:hypothetical protein
VQQQRVEVRASHDELPQLALQLALLAVLLRERNRTACRTSRSNKQLQ